MSENQKKARSTVVSSQNVGAAGQIRTADLILTNTPENFPDGVRLSQTIPNNPAIPRLCGLWLHRQSHLVPGCNMQTKRRLFAKCLHRGMTLAVLCETLQCSGRAEISPDPNNFRVFYCVQWILRAKDHFRQLVHHKAALIHPYPAYHDSSTALAG